MSVNNIKDFQPSRILVIQLRQIGDVLLTTPSVRALRERYPGARIEYLVEPLPGKVLLENKNIDGLIIRDPKEGGIEPVKTIFKVRRKKFDLVIDFLANPRTAAISILSGAKVTISYADNRRSGFYTHAVKPEGVFSAAQKLSLLRVLGIENAPVRLEFPVSDTASSKMGKWLSEKGLDTGDGPLVCLEPFQKWPVLEYPADGFRELCEKMVAKWDARVVVCWGPGREDDAKKIVDGASLPLTLCPPTDLHEIAALYARSDFWVGNDSGPRHIAASQGLSTFAIFGPTDDAWTPPGDHLSVGLDELSCRPCNKRYCPEEHHKCMVDFSVEDVFRLLEEFWEKVKHD